MPELTAEALERLLAVKTLTDFDFSFQPASKREQIDSLSELGFGEHRENVIFLGDQDAHGHRYGREWPEGLLRPLTDLIDSLEEAQAAGRLSRPLKTLTRPVLLVVDETGYLPVKRSGAIRFLPSRHPALRVRLQGIDFE